MAGGQERILRGRIRSDPGDEEDHARHGADRGVADRQGPAARARRRAVQRADHRGREGPRGRRWRVERLAVARRPQRDQERRATSSSPPTAVCAVATTPASSAPPRARSRPTCSPASDYTIIPVGRKAEGYFRFRGYHLGQAFTGFSDSPTYDDASAIGEHVVDLFTVGRGRLASSSSTPASSRPARRKSCCARSCRSTATRSPAATARPPAPTARGGDYEFEPDPTTILDTLLPRYVEARIYAALLNAAASEHAFRQRAMKAPPTTPRSSSRTSAAS